MIQLLTKAFDNPKLRRVNELLLHVTLQHFAGLLLLFVCGHTWVLLVLL